MRIKLSLAAEERCAIPINYQHPLSSAIYKILSSSSSNYAEFLHEKGYVSKGGRPIKLFTFSYLYIPRVTRKGNVLYSNHATDCTLYVSSPLLDDFMQNFVAGLFLNQNLVIGNQVAAGRFVIKSVESLPTPLFSERQKFKCLSPFVLSTMREKNNHLKPYYYRPDDPELEDAIRNNLIHKYRTAYNKLAIDDTLFFELDQDYIKRRGGLDKITKLITLKETNEKERTQIKAIYAPFTLTGSTELMNIAWHAGLGAHCSQGFGCVETS